MTIREADASASFKMGKKQTDAMVAMQKDLIEVYEQASRAWITRMKSEMELWSGLGAKLSASRSIPEVLATFQKCMAQRAQMATEDGRQLVEEYQKFSQKITRSMSNGWSTGSR